MSAFDEAKDKAEEAGKKVGDFFDDVKENLSDAKDHVTDTFDAVKKDVAAEVNEHKHEDDAPASTAPATPAE